MQPTQIRSVKDVEYLIRRALWTDKKLPKVGPRYPKCLHGKMMPIEDTERSVEDILEDIPFRERPTKEDIENWELVLFDWLPSLDPQVRDIVIKRCSGMGWKRLAYEHGRDRTTLWRSFSAACKKLLQHAAMF